MDIRTIVFEPSTIPEEIREVINEKSLPIDGEWDFIMENDLIKLLRKTKWRIKSFQPSAAYAGCFVAEFTNEKPSARLLNEDYYEGNKIKSLLAVFNQTLVKQVGDVLISCVGYNYVDVSEMRTDGKFVVIIAGQKEIIKANENNITHFYDIYVDYPGQNLISPSGKGIPIIDPTSSICIAELCPEALYIHYNLIFGQNDFMILKNILTKVVEIMNYSPEELTQYRCEAQILQNTYFKQKYIETCSIIKSVRANNLRSELQDHTRNIEHYEQEVIKSIRKYNELRAMIDGLESNFAFSNERYAEEFDKLLSLEKVKAITIDQKYINVFTVNLYCPVDSDIYDIGEFKIRIPHSGSGGVRWINLTRTVKGYSGSMAHAPHVFDADGSACLGSTHDVFSQLIANCEYAAAAMIAINFVESVNLNDNAGKTIYNWPLKHIIRTEPVNEPEQQQEMPLYA